MPTAAGVKTDFHFFDRPRPSVGDALEQMLFASQYLVVAGAVDARRDLNRAVVRPSLALPIALVISFVYFNLGNPFDVLDAEDPGNHGP